MIVKVNGEVFNVLEPKSDIVNVAEHLWDMVQTPLNTKIDVGEHELVHFDLNPVNNMSSIIDDVTSFLQVPIQNIKTTIPTDSLSSFSKLIDWSSEKIAKMSDHILEVLF